MKKRRSTVYVRPGKDVTLYIPSDTPQEVIDYLNRLKTEGTFSQGIVDILTAHIREEGFLQQETGDVPPHPGDLPLEPYGESPYSIAEDEEEDPPAADGQELENPMAQEPRRFSLAQIFRQARHNSDKI